MTACYFTLQKTSVVAQFSSSSNNKVFVFFFPQEDSSPEFYQLRDKFKMHSC